MGSVATVAALDDAVARIGRRFGAHALVRGASFERRSDEGVLRTGTAFDRIAGGVPTGAPCAFVGRGACGKLALALRAVAAAQREGAHAMWVDPTASLDAVGASHAGVDLGRLLVVRTRTRDDTLTAAAAALRSGGFRLVALDTGPQLLVPQVRADDIAPLIPLVHGSAAALIVVTDHAPDTLALPTFRFERVAWERELGRTTGWTFRVAGRGAEALFQARSSGCTLLDLGVRGELGVRGSFGVEGDGLEASA